MYIFLLLLAAMDGSASPTERVWQNPLSKYDLSIVQASATTLVNMAVSSNDHILMIDNRSRELVIIGPDGELLNRAGRRGQGPQELNKPKILGWVEAEKLFYIIDEGNARISRWTDTGDFVDETTFVGGFLRKAAYKDKNNILYRAVAEGVTGRQPSISQYNLQTQETKPFWKMSASYENNLAGPSVKPLSDLQLIMVWHPRIHFQQGSDFLAVNYYSEDLLILDLATGEERKKFSVAIPQIEISDAYYEHVMESYGRMRSHFESFDRPENWQPVAQLDIDANDQIWVFGHLLKPYGESRFAVHKPTGELIHQGMIPGVGQVSENNHIYSFQMDPEEGDELVLIKTNVK